MFGFLCEAAALVLECPGHLGALRFKLPGVLIGGQIGPYVSSKVSSYYGERALVGLFLFLGCVMGAIGAKEAIDKWG